MAVDIREDTKSNSTQLAAQSTYEIIEAAGDTTTKMVKIQRNKKDFSTSKYLSQYALRIKALLCMSYMYASIAKLGSGVKSWDTVGE